VKHAIALLLALTCLALGSPARAADPDPWWGKDKALHCAVSIGLGSGGYAGSALWLDQRWQRAVAGAGFSLTLGAGKELYDLGGHGDASWRDFTWDIAGTAVGVGLAYLVDLAFFPRTRRRADPAREPIAE
jgi:putative lipoprotein